MIESMNSAPLSEDEALRRKASRVVLKAAQRDEKEGQRRNIERVKSFTSKNREKMDELLTQPLVLYKRDPNIPLEIEIDSDVKEKLPPDFFADPTSWIESQPILDRTDENMYTGRLEDFMYARFIPEDETIESLMKRQAAAMDVSMVRVFRPIENFPWKVLSIRLNGKKHAGEIERAREAYARGIPTPRIFGVISHHGNTYALFEALPGINLNAFFKLKITEDIKQRVLKKKAELAELVRQKGMDHKDFANRNIVILFDKEKNEPTLDSHGDPQLFVIDWEEVPESGGGTTLHAPRNEEFARNRATVWERIKRLIQRWWLCAK